MKIVPFVGVLVLLFLILGSASAYSPGLKLEKSASPTTYNYAGQTITYTYKVTNSGNVKISGPITITDNKIGTFTISTKDLRPGATVNGKAIYKVNNQDLKNGSLTNLASATGKYNKQKIVSNTASRTITAGPNPSLAIVVSASPTTYSAARQTITYTYKVTNSGNVKISGPITVTDNKIGTFTVSTRDLGPGEVVSGKATYRTNSQDLNAGSVKNLASAAGKYNKQKIVSNTASSTVSSGQKLAMTIEKSASPTTYDYAGQAIIYTYKVTNSGNFKISGPITVTDNKIGTFTISTGDLPPGAVVNGKSTYKITDKDLNAGSVTNLAYAAGMVTNLAYTAGSAPNGASIVGCSSKKVTSNEAKVTITKVPLSVPEFPSLVVPVIAVLGLLFISQRKRKER